MVRAYQLAPDGPWIDLDTVQAVIGVQAKGDLITVCLRHAFQNEARLYHVYHGVGPIDVPLAPAEPIGPVRDAWSKLWKEAQTKRYADIDAKCLTVLNNLLAAWQAQPEKKQ